MNPQFKRHNIELNSYNIFLIFIIGLGFVFLLWQSFLQLCNHVVYITFNTNLNLFSKTKIIVISPLWIWSYLSLFMLGLLLSECEKDQILLLIIRTSPNVSNTFDFALRYSKMLSRTFFTTLTIYMFSIANTPAACILCLTVFQIWCLSYKKIFNFGCQ